jgi:hypothetical protein
MNGMNGVIIGSVAVSICTFLIWPTTPCSVTNRNEYEKQNPKPATTTTTTRIEHPTKQLKKN